VLDADNICDGNFLQVMNDALKSGYQLVQGQRIAKNTDTPYALLDAVSEGINNHIFRKGHRAAGLSCAVIGSGMAMEYELFKQVMPEITAVGGFDKEMELRLLKRRICFGYAEKALVYDEKTPARATFENQRRRWMSAQLHYLRIYLGEGFVQLSKGNVDFFDKVMQTLLLPRVILIVVTPMLALLSLFTGDILHPVYWFFLWEITYMAILLSVPRKFVNKRLWGAVCRLPLASFTMFKLFFKLKGANKTFIHTTHGHTK
jgi:cellulose synthase/poly-beta-1,6-N-acetylglucosamine synthase-like glycosyltransferase